jgi:hypothetical protein
MHGEMEVIFFLEHSQKVSRIHLLAALSAKVYTIFIKLLSVCEVFRKKKYDNMLS